MAGPGRPFEKGNTAGPGRPKGGGTKMVREIVEKHTGKTLIEELLKLADENPRHKLAVYKELLPYCYPKFSVIEVQADIDVDVQSDAVTALAQWLTGLIEVEGERQ